MRPSIRPPLPRSALSLIEVMISLGIFSLLIGATMHSVSGVRSFVDARTQTNDLALEGRRVMDEMVADLGNSAWFIPGDADGNGQFRPPDGTDLTDLAALADPTRDRTLRYYPYLLAQSPTAIPAGSFFAGLSRGPTAVVDTTLLPSALPAEHRKLSREVVFLKLRNGAAAPTPQQIQPAQIDFRTAPPSIAFFSTAANRTAAGGGGVIVENLGLKPMVLDATVVDDSPLAWETDSGAPALAWNTSSPPDATKQRLLQADYAREYTYVVVPAAKGKRQLQRRYRNQGSGYSAAATAVVDRVLSENVDRLVIDTYRTCATLGVNQVRIALYLSKEMPDHPGEYVSHHVEVIAALRSAVDPEYSLGLKAILAGKDGSNQFRGGVFLVPTP